MVHPKVVGRPLVPNGITVSEQHRIFNELDAAVSNFIETCPPMQSRDTRRMVEQACGVTYQDLSGKRVSYRVINEDNYLMFLLKYC